MYGRLCVARVCFVFCFSWPQALLSLSRWLWTGDEIADSVHVGPLTAICRLFSSFEFGVVRKTAFPSLRPWDRVYISRYLFDIFFSFLPPRYSISLVMVPLSQVESTLGQQQQHVLTGGTRKVLVS